MKDDERLLDEGIAAVHDQMMSSDRARAEHVISLIIRRHRHAKCAFRAAHCQQEATTAHNRDAFALKRSQFALTSDAFVIFGCVLDPILQLAVSFRQ